MNQFYYPASACRFYTTTKPQTVSLPSGCSWEFSFTPGFLQFSHSGSSYRLALSPNGLLQGFAEPITADSLAQLCIVKFNTGREITQWTYARAQTPESAIAEALRAATAPISGKAV